MSNKAKRDALKCEARKVLKMRLSECEAPEAVMAMAMKIVRRRDRLRFQWAKRRHERAERSFASNAESTRKRLAEALVHA